MTPKKLKSKWLINMRFSGRFQKFGANRSVRN